MFQAGEQHELEAVGLRVGGPAGPSQHTAHATWLGSQAQHLNDVCYEKLLRNKTVLSQPQRESFADICMYAYIYIYIYTQCLKMQDLLISTHMLSQGWKGTTGSKERMAFVQCQRTFNQIGAPSLILSPLK